MQQQSDGNVFQTILLRLSAVAGVRVHERQDGRILACLCAYGSEDGSVLLPLMAAADDAQTAILALYEECLRHPKIIRCASPARGERAVFEWVSRSEAWVLRAKDSGEVDEPPYGWTTSWAAWGLQHGLFPVVRSPGKGFGRTSQGRPRVPAQYEVAWAFSAQTGSLEGDLPFRVPTTSTGVTIAYGALAFCGTEAESREHHSRILASFEEQCRVIGVRLVDDDSEPPVGRGRRM